MSKIETFDECRQRCFTLLKDWDFEKAMVCANDMLDIYENNNYTYYIDNIFKGHDRIYLHVSKSLLYMTYLNRLMDIYISQERLFERVDIGYRIADIYLKGKEHEKAEMMLSRLFKLAQKSNYYKGQADLLNGLGNVQNQRKNYGKALEFYMRAYKLSIKHRYKKGTRFAHNIGYIHKTIKEYDKAIMYFNIALEYMLQIGEYDFCANTYNELGDTYIRNGNYELANDYLEKGLGLSKKTKSLHFVEENYLFQSKLFENQHEYKKSLDSYKKYHDIEKTISKSDHQLEINQFQYEMYLKNKQDENELMRIKNLELDSFSKELNRTNNALKEALKEAKLMHEKAFRSEKYAAYNRMIIGISHMINTSIGSVIVASSHVELQVNDIESEFKGGSLTKNGMEMFLETCHQDMVIIKSSLDRVTRSVGGLKDIPLSIEEIGIESKLDKIIDECKNEFEKKYSEISCSYDLGIEDGISTLKGAVIYKRVFSQLFDNAYKYAFIDVINCRIEISISLSESNELLIRFSDNGVGIDEDIIKRIFDPFYTTNMGTVGGSGLGLFITYKIVTEVLNGTIKCESKTDSGTSFIITIPNRGVIDSF